MPRVARAWPSEVKPQEEVKLGKPRAVRRETHPASTPANPTLRLSGQLRNQKESSLSSGTAFDLSSTAWMPLTRGHNGAFRLGQDEPGPVEEAPPPPGGTQAGPMPEPGVNLTLAEAEAYLDELDRSIGKIAQATAEDLARCGFVDPLILADARSFRARLAQELGRPGAAGVTVTLRDVHAAELVTTCARALSSISLRMFAVIGAVAIAFGVIVFGLS